MINTLGTRMDMELVDGAIRLSEKESDALGNDIRKFSGVENPTVWHS